MKYLSIDLGSYSVKTMLVKFERKQLEILDIKEFILDDLEGVFESDVEKESLHSTLVEDIIPENFEGKTIFQLPNNLITSRHIHLPVTQKKKVDMMIPFQLDENLPFSTTDAHFISHQVKKEQGTSCLINVTKKQEFENFINPYDQKDCLPTLLTSELSIFHSYAQNQKVKGPYAILDIGHKSSNCYLIYEGEIVSYHTSFCAGQNINEIISETYDKSESETVLYKHQNCFFLTENQYADVTEEQRDFAYLMGQTMRPLIYDLKRWTLGFRVKYGIPIEEIFLTGGTSNIQNIENFISQQTKIKTSIFTLNSYHFDINEKFSSEESKFFLSGLMVSNLIGKVKPGNFLVGDYALGTNLGLPIHSIGFYFSRVAIFSLVISLILGLDTYIQKGKEKEINKTLRTLVKRKELELNSADQRGYKKRIGKIKKNIQTKNRQMRDELNVLMSATKKNGLSSLERVFEMFNATEKIELYEFSSSPDLVSGIFKGEDKKALNKIQKTLESSNLKNLKINVKENLLNFSFNNE